MLATGPPGKSLREVFGHNDVLIKFAPSGLLEMSLLVVILGIILFLNLRAIRGELALVTRAFQEALVVNNLPASTGDMRLRSDPWVGKILWRRARQPIPVFLPRESHGQRSLLG